MPALVWGELLSDGLDLFTLLFSESSGRVVVSFRAFCALQGYVHCLASSLRTYCVVDAESNALDFQDEVSID